MAYGVSTRTLFLVVRGVYQGRPLQELGKDLEKLDKKEKQHLARKHQMINIAYQHAYAMIFEGVAITAFASMAMFAFVKIIEKSKEGKVFMEKFGKSIDDSLGKLGTAFLRVLGPALTTFANILNAIASNPVASILVAGFATVLVTMALVYGLSKLLGGAWGILTLKTTTFANLLPALNTQLAGTIGTMNMLAATLMRMMIPFTLFYTIGSLVASQNPALVAGIGALIAILSILGIVLWSNATAMSILTFGVAAGIGLAASAAAAAMTPTPSYGIGTSMIRETGPAYVHAGEIIKSTRESPEAGLIKTAGMQPAQRTFNFDFRHTTIHTKADKEELIPLMKRVLRDAVNSKS